MTSVGRIAFEWDEVAVAPTSFTAAAAGGTGAVNVYTNCSWTASSDASWITITAGSSGTHDGSVSISVGGAGARSAELRSMRL
ncbi:MAG TPA: hypothetical protein VKE96_05095 [Vicinamibacterales bacterium]|nr:hypothetical protein [Vicinamibacterales bacterium]